MASPTGPGTEPSEDLKRELDERVGDDEANPDERVPAKRFIADLRKKFKPIVPNGTQSSSADWNARMSMPRIRTLIP